MRIGIDAKWYFTGPPSGRNVVRNIVNHIIEDTNHQFVLIFDKKNKTEVERLRLEWSNKKNVEFFYVMNFLNVFTNSFLFPLYLKKKNLDVVLCQNYIPLWGLKNIKKVSYIHDFLFIDFPQYFTFFEKIIYKLMIISAQKSDHIITISKSEQQRIVRSCNIVKSKIDYVYHGLDSIFEVKSEVEIEMIKLKYSLPNEYILYVGRLNQRKNIATLLKSLSLLKTDIKLVVIGSVHTKAFNLQKEVNILNIKDRVIKLGFVNDHALSEILAAAKLFVFPSYAEGFGLPPLEAMKCGVPVIVSDQTSLPEVCGEAALYFEVNSVEGLSQKIDELMSDSTLRKSYIQKGIEHSTQFKWYTSVGKIIEIFEKL